jgi:hypothetical protein
MREERTKESGELRADDARIKIEGNKGKVGEEQQQHRAGESNNVRQCSKEGQEREEESAAQHVINQCYFCMYM